MDDVTLDDVARRIVRTAVEEAITGLRTEMQQRFEAFRSDPLAFISLRAELLTTAKAAELTNLHPETIARWTRLPVDHPDHLPRVNDHPILIVPADLAAWVERRRATAVSNH